MLGSTFNTAGSFSWITGKIALVNTAMNTLQGNNSDYQLTTFDLRLASIDPRNPLRKLKFPTTAPVPNNSDVDAITAAMIEMRL